MIFDESIDEKRTALLEYLKDQNFRRVLDIGGVMYPWARDYVTHYFDGLDIHQYLGRSPEFYNEKVRDAISFVGDINGDTSGKGWEDVCEDVNRYGKFDFIICSQTIEDIRSPVVPLRIMSTIGKEGFITVPTKYRELTYVENYAPVDLAANGLTRPYVGYFHHRWIFTIQDGILVLFPKLEFCNCLDLLNIIIAEVGRVQYDKGMQYELSFRWKDDIPFRIIGGDYLGPNPGTIFDTYRRELKKGL